MQTILNLLDIERDRKKTLKKEKENRRMKKIQKTTNIFFTFTFLCRKILC